MKKLTYLMSLVCLALFASCSSDIDDFATENNNAKTITVNVENGADTRFDSSNLQLMKWTTGDVLYVVYDGTRTEELTMQEFNEGKAKFNAPEAGHSTYKFFYSGSGKTANDINAIDYLSQFQGDFTTTNLKNHILLQSDEYTTVPSTEIQLKNRSKVMKINVKDFPAGLDKKTYTYVSLVLGGHKVATTTLAPALVKGENNFIYMAFDHPTTANELAKGDEIAVEFEKDNAKFVAKGTCSELKKYEAGKIYSLVVNSTSTDTDRALVWEKEQVADVQPLKIKFVDGYAAPDKIGTANDSFSFMSSLTRDSEKPDADGFYSYTISEGVMESGDNAIFATLKDNTNIKEVIVPANITDIRADAFSGCTNLIKVTIPADSKLANIGGSAFASTKITSLTFPATVKTLGEFVLKNTEIKNIIVKCPFNADVAMGFAKLFGIDATNKYVDAPAGCAIHVDATWNTQKFTKEGSEVQCVAGKKFCDVLYTSVDNTIN